MRTPVSNLNEAEQRFRNLFNGAPFSAALLTGDEFIIEMANEATLKLWGKDASIIGQPLLVAMPEIRDQAVFHLLREVYHTGEFYEGKEREALLNDNGILKKIYVNFTYTPIKNDAATITGVLAVGYDVTDQVLYRQKLQESEERIKLAIHAAGLGTFDKDYKTGETSSSANLAGIFGYNEPVPFENYISRIHPNDRMIRTAAHIHAFSSGKLFYEARVVMPDQSMKWIRVNGTIFFDDLRNPSRLIGTALDISEEKNLKESEERFRILISETPDVGMGLYLGRELRIQYVNDVMLRFWGKNKSILGKTMREALPELYGQPFFRQLDNVFTTGVPFTGKETKAILEVNGKLTNGYYNYTYKPLRNTQGEIYAIHHMAMDVTDHVKSKLKLIESGESVRRLFKQTPVGISVFKGEKLIIEMINDAMLSFWGRTYDEVINKPLWEVLPEVETQGISKISAQVYKTGEPYASSETPVTLLRNGKMETIYVYFAFEPLKDEDGNIIALMSIANDVTELVNARKKAEKNEMHLQQLADAMPQVVWIAEGDGRVTYYNDRVKDFAGVTRDGDIWKWETTVHPDDLEATANAWNHAVERMVNYQVEHRIKMKDGAYRWHLSRAYPYKTEEGIKWYGTATDVHAQKVLEMNLEDLIKERTRELERSNEELQQFAHVASHDLKEPIRKIKTFSHQLQDEYKELLGVRGNRYVNKIIHATKRMYAMIDGVLNYAAIPSANTFEAVDLNAVIQTISIDLEILIQEKNATIHSENLPAIKGLPDLIHQLFYNLINNSLKFARPAVPAYIDIRCAKIRLEDKGFHEILISDNGIGFDEGYAEQIFVTFFRLHSKDKYEGTGLGLALCKKIVEQHGGLITAKSQKGSGAQFIMLLPE